MNATDILEAALGNALFLGDAFPTVTQWTVCLFSTIPNYYLISKILQPTLFCAVNRAQTGASFTLESGHADESDSISSGVIVARVS